MEFILRAIRVAEAKHIPHPATFLAEAAGVDRGRITRWKKGEGAISLEQAVGIARALGVSLDSLTGGEERAGVEPLTHDQRMILDLVEDLGLTRAVAVQRLAMAPAVHLGDPPVSAVRTNAMKVRTSHEKPPG